MKTKRKKGIGFVINMINNNNDEDTKKEDIKNAQINNFMCYIIHLPTVNQDKVLYLLYQNYLLTAYE